MANPHLLETSVVISVLLTVVAEIQAVSHISTDFTTEYYVLGNAHATACGRPAVHNGQMTENKDNFTRGESVEITCLSGFRLPFTKAETYSLTCGVDGHWTDVMGRKNFPQCQRAVACPVPEVPHGWTTTKPDGYMPGELLQIMCHQGYHTGTGRALIRCQNDGSWQPVSSFVPSPRLMPLCNAIVCAAPAPILHGSFMREPTTATLSTERYPEGSSVLYLCDQGYRMDDPSKAHRTCGKGEWTTSAPVCIKSVMSRCFPPESVKHARYEVIGETGAHIFSSVVPDGSRVRYVCDKGYSLLDNGELLPVCLRGKWRGALPQCIPAAKKDCDRPPIVKNGNFIMSGNTLDSKEFTEGQQVHYHCDNGYKLKEVNASFLVCRNRQWHGQEPVCERRTHCDKPMDIINGNWVTEFYVPHYGIGSRITYECWDGYKPIGTTRIECMSTGYWSDYAPRCLASSQYCSEPGPLENGVYMCRPSHCDLFKIGTEIHFVCNKFYEPRTNDIMVQKCTAGGHWSGQKPVCESVKVKTGTDNLVSFNTSTLTVVIATSCGVLGLLVVVMVVVALQRRRKKPRNNRLCDPSSPHPPPPYNPTPPTGLVDEPDRVALIAFADGVQVVLPSYEEAVRGRPGSRISRYTSDSTRGSIRSSSSRDYRPLPSLPSNLRTGGPQIREIPADHHHDHHRNSIITTASITTRDNLSLALGSIDTMNISDGTSTSVTVDTASSNPSIATSQRAAAGSIESSSTNGSLATEDVPLLDQNHYGTETMRSHHSNASDSYHGNSSRFQCTERIGGYDTLRSQGSRSQSESSPIAEEPEDQKDS